MIDDMTKIIQHPKQVRYHDGNDVTGLKRYHDHLFGDGSWEELEKGVLERYPDFAPGGIWEKEEKLEVPSRKWWQFWRPKTNVVKLFN